MMTLEKFAIETKLVDQSELDKVALLAYFALQQSNVNLFDSSDVAIWFDKLNLAKPNQTRLRKKMRSSSSFICKQNGVSLHAKSISAIDQQYPELIEKLRQPVNSTKNGAHTYVDLVRLSELRTISSKAFDLSKLIRLCEELNHCFTTNCYYGSAMLTRAVIDHIPPIFGAKTFTEVANNHASSKSIKSSLQQLDLSCRKIADQHLHTQIRKAETTPTKTQIDFSNDLDVLLSEIVRLLK